MSVATPTGAPAPEDVEATRCAVLVDEWARAGVRRAVVAPGSRSTPLVLALAAHGAVALDVRLDERSAGFFALGAARATGRPVVLCTTSGTAAAELHAAVMEAAQARVPLLVCTADRPLELHGVAAPQTVDQRGLFAAAPRAAFELGVAEWGSRGSWRSMGARIAAEAVAGPLGPGPVHVNVAFREPLLGSALELPPGRPGGKPWHRVVGSEPEWGEADRSSPANWPGPRKEGPGAAAWARRLAGRRGVVLAGADGAAPDALWALADALRWPVAADPLSGCRAARAGVVGAADAIARSADAVERLAPEVLLRSGAPWASRALGDWCAGLGPATEQIVVDRFWRWPDPTRQAGEIVAADPTGWARAVTAALDASVCEETPPSWREAWAAAEAAAWAAVESWCGARTEATEPALARAVASAVAPDGLLVVSSSMPVRDVEWFVAPASTPRVLGNRGANGIDGVVSTALGAAADGMPVTALVGDLAFLHDLTAWVRPAGFRADCTVVVADNGGGGIFSFLPHAAALDARTFTELFCTPQGVDVALAAAGLGLGVDDVADMAGVHDALGRARRSGGLRVVRVRLPGAAANAALHGELVAATGAAIDAALADVVPWG